MAKKSYVIDMDGVLISGRVPIPGADTFLQRLRGREDEVDGVLAQADRNGVFGC